MQHVYNMHIIGSALQTGLFVIILCVLISFITKDVSVYDQTFIALCSRFH